jgi:hypothetical protein
MPNYSGSWTLRQQMQAIAAGTWPSPPPILGQAFGGGFYAGEVSTAGNGVADYYLVVAPASTGVGYLAWKNVATATPGADSTINGAQNTADMVADGNATVYPIAHFCNDLVIGGYTDWYFPAKFELEICYFNLKPTIAGNNGSFGANPYSVPTRTGNYTSGNPATNPAQTTVAAFQDTGAEDFIPDNIAASNETSTTNAYMKNFGNGADGSDNKTFPFNFRAIRKVPV